MDSKQKKADFLANVGRIIPKLFQAITEGNERSEYILGTRTIRDRQVRLVLVAEVVDPGSNPLATHSAARDLAEQSGKGHSAEPTDLAIE